MIQGGRTATKHGQAFEDMIHDRLVRLGYKELDANQRKAFKDPKRTLRPPSPFWFVRQVRVGRSVYGTEITSDFYVFRSFMERGKEPLVIEVKFQQTAGSVDEKYVYTVQSLLGFNCDVCLVMEGKGARPEAIRWVQDQAKKSRGKLSVFNSTAELIQKSAEVLDPNWEG